MKLQKQKRELADALLAGDSKGSIVSEMSVEDLELLLS